MLDAFGLMEEKSTSLTNYRLISEMKEFGKSLHATHTAIEWNGRMQKSTHPRSGFIRCRVFPCVRVE